jgi:outer membrane lipoprotein SlyB
VLGDAAGAAAWHLPYGGSTATSTAVRTAAIAGTAAASTIASNTRAKDEMQIEYRLTSGNGVALREGKDRAKASSDGEDLVTPLVERMAGVVAAAAPR